MPYIDTDYSFVDVSGLWSLDKWGERNGGRYFNPKLFPNTTRALDKFKKAYKAAKDEYEQGLEDLNDTQIMLEDLEQGYTPEQLARHRSDLDRQFVLATQDARAALLKKAEPEIYRAVFMIIRFMFNNGGAKDEQGTVQRYANVTELEPIMDALQGTDTERALFGLNALLAMVEDLSVAPDVQGLATAYKGLNTTGREAMDNMALYLTGQPLLSHGYYDEGGNS